MGTENLWAAFGLTLFAGLCTGIGSALAFLTKQTNKKFLSLALGFSAGVMIYVSMIEIFRKAQDSLIMGLGEKMGSWVTVLSFFGGMLFIAAIDKLIPSHENPHEVHRIEELDEAEKPKLPSDEKKLLRMGVFTAIAVAIHNFPEGFATLIASLQDPNLGVSIAIAVAIHNIPEGIAVSIPLYYATGSRKKPFITPFFQD